MLDAQMEFAMFLQCRDTGDTWQQMGIILDEKSEEA
jgi:hypothetical protein